MISGKITDDLEPTVPLTVLSEDGQGETIQATVDTGFNGWLSLPTELILRRNFVWLTREEGTLADGKKEMFDIFNGIVKWRGQDRRVFVSATLGHALIGMSLLEGSGVNMQVKPGGDVTIAPLE